jgi:hypothetical protein
VIVLPWLTPDTHQRYALTLVRLSEKTSDPDTAAALLELAANHLALAKLESSAQQSSNELRR